MSPSTHNLRVYLVDNSYCDVSLDLRSTTAKQACVLVCAQLGISKDVAKYYALYASDDCIRSDSVIPSQDTLEAYVDIAAKVVFRVRLFVPSLLRSTDPLLIQNLYLEASNQVVGGRFKCPTSLLLRLASYQVLINESSHGSIQLNPNAAAQLSVTLAGQLCPKLLEYLPLYAFDNRKPSKWEADILKEMKRLGNGNGDDEKNPMVAYVENAKLMTTFGSTYFDVSHCSDPELDTPLKLGVGTIGITLFDEDFDHIKKRIRLDELQTWGYRGKSTFYVTQRKSKIIFEVKSDPAEICLLLHDYATNFKAEELEKQAAEERERQHEKERKGKLKMEIKRRKGAAAVSIQKIARGHAVRSAQAREYGATCIQTAFRGYKARCRFDAQISALETQVQKHTVASNSAATKLQAFARGVIIRQALYREDQDVCARIIQFWFRQQRAANRSRPAVSKKHRVSQQPPEPLLPPPPGNPEPLEFPPPVTPPPGLGFSFDDQRV